MKILISSNSPWGPTGYGSQAKIIMDLCLEFGHEVALFAWYGFDAHPLEIGGVKVWPRLDHDFGGDAPAVLRQWPADLLITIQDIWPLPYDFGREVRKAGADWLAYFPIDGEPLAPMVAEMARTTDHNVIYSEYGAQQMRAAEIDYHYIPQLIDTDIYSPGDRANARLALGIPAEAYLVLMVGANIGSPGRKSYPEAMAAFARFRDDHPEAVLFIHAKKNMPIGQGYQMSLLANTLGLGEDHLKFINQDAYTAAAMSPADMANLYRAADVLLQPSRGEGFGLPIAEAQAVGTPVITQAATAMTEITYNGIAVEPLQRHYTKQNHYQFIASEERIGAALYEIYNRGADDRARLGTFGANEVNRRHGLNEINKNEWRQLLRRIDSQDLSPFRMNYYSDKKPENYVAIKEVS